MSDPAPRSQERGSAPPSATFELTAGDLVVIILGVGKIATEVDRVERLEQIQDLYARLATQARNAGYLDLSALCSGYEMGVKLRLEKISLG